VPTIAANSYLTQHMSRKAQKRNGITFLAACALAIVACNSASTSPPEGIQSISIAAPDGKNSLNIAVNGTVTLQVNGKDVGGAAIAITGTPTFVSRNASIASVDSKGVLLALKTGSTYVIVTLATPMHLLSDSIHVTVGSGA
jgi:hypothetical protein